LPKLTAVPETWKHTQCAQSRLKGQGQQDAVRLARKVGRKDVGVGFNLCHFLKLDDERNLELRLKEAMPDLFAVSINGTDGGNTQQMQ
jgi:hypothetical protein